MNRIRSIGRFACLLAELALTGRNPLTKAAKSRVRHRLTLVAAMAGLVAPLATALPATQYVTGSLMQPLRRTR